MPLPVPRLSLFGVLFFLNVPPPGIVGAEASRLVPFRVARCAAGSSTACRDKKHGRLAALAPA